MNEPRKRGSRNSRCHHRERDLKSRIAGLREALEIVNKRSNLVLNPISSEIGGRIKELTEEFQAVRAARGVDERQSDL